MNFSFYALAVIALLWSGLVTGLSAQDIDAKLGGASSSEVFVVTDNAVTPDSLFTVRGDGNVGIGTADPEYALDIIGPGTGTLTSRIDYNAAGGGSIFLRMTERNHRGAYLRYNNDNNIFYIGVHEGADTLSSGDENIISIDRTTGYVGINDATPDFEFDISGDDTVVTLLKGNVANSVSYVRFAESNFRGGYVSYDGVGNDFHIGVHNDDDEDAAGDNDAITIDRSTGNIGIGTTPDSNPLLMASGAYVTSGGVWTNSSSRRLKENIRELDLDVAIEGLDDLVPVRFNYKADKGEEHLGFIAEEVPELIASKERKGLSSMDVVALLTRVVQHQQNQIRALQRRLEAMDAE